MANKIRLFSVDHIDLAILESDPPKLAITVSGLATTSGWSDAALVPLEKKLSADGILDLDFVAVPPSGIVLQKLTMMSANTIWNDDVDRLVGVKIYSRTNEPVRLLREFHPEAMAKTMAVGEEGPPLTTFAVGEEGPRPTTLVAGEEGPGPTTFAIGEEGAPPSTLAVGEEGFPGTTKRLGEEGPTAFWGEGPTTWRFGEEHKGFVGETSPTVDDPKPPFGEQGDWPDEFSPFGRR